MGDDTTDEDAFQLLNKDAMTIRVGWSRHTKAQYFVRNVAEVKRLLEAIAMVEEEELRSVIVPKTMLPRLKNRSNNRSKKRNDYLAASTLL